MIRRVLLPALFLFSCSNGSEKEVGSVLPNKNVSDTLQKTAKPISVRDSALSRTPVAIPDTTLRLPWKTEGVIVHCIGSRAPETKGTILVLPGWNHSPLFWRDKMRFCDLASQAGFNLILPEMQKGVYTDHPFPETRKDMVNAPTLKFITGVLLPECTSRWGVLDSGGFNYIAGISTGARGSVLVAMEQPGVFRRGVAMSGDYDNSKLKDDRVMINYYGPKQKFEKRWAEEANPAARVEDLTIPFLFIHAKDDQVVRYSHSAEFVALLHSSGITTAEMITADSGGHTYPFWDTYTERIIDHFVKP